MSKPYGINGTPWHVERVHNNNPDDSRRHRSRCIFYDPKAKYCSKQVGDCYGASHCKYYKEGRSDLITTDTATFETVQYEPAPSSFIPERARDGTSENQIRVGDMVQKYGGKYMILDASLDENRHHVYSCVQAREYPSKAAAQGLISIYSSWYLTDRDPQKCHAYEFGTVQHLPDAVVSRVRSERERWKAREKLVSQKPGAEGRAVRQVEKYSVSPYLGRFSRPAGVKVDQMYMVVKSRGARKKLPVKVNMQDHVIYMEQDLYDIHRAAIETETFELVQQ